MFSYYKQNGLSSYYKLLKADSTQAPLPPDCLMLLCFTLAHVHSHSTDSSPTAGLSAPALHTELLAALQEHDRHIHHFPIVSNQSPAMTKQWTSHVTTSVLLPSPLFAFLNFVDLLKWYNSERFLFLKNKGKYILAKYILQLEYAPKVSGQNS